MHNVLEELRWTSAIIGALLLIIGIVIAASAGSGARRRGFGWFALQFGASLLLFNVAGYLGGRSSVPNDHAWTTAVVLAAVILLASSVRKMFGLGNR